MKYFLHDSNARNDEKVTLIHLEYGYEGVGLFYCILEILAAQEKPVNEKVLKSQLNIRKKLEKQLNFMYKTGILSVKNGEVFNENILNFSEKYLIKKEKTRKKVSEWRDKQRDTKTVTSYVPVRNPPKDNINKDNINKDNKEGVAPPKKEKIFSAEIINFTGALCKFMPESITEKLTHKEKLGWIDTIDKLIRIDQFTEQQILKAVKNGRESHFWAKNFLSLNKLRKNQGDVKYIHVFLNLPPNGSRQQYQPETQMEALKKLSQLKFADD